MKKNLVLISLDTLRADVAYSGGFDGIEFLRKRGVTFINTISSSPLTPVSHSTVFTGLQPYHHGVRHLFKEKLQDNSVRLAEYFKKEGYDTGAIVSCPGMNKWYGFGKGFDHYDDEIPRLPDGSDPLLTVDVKKRGVALKRANIVAERAKKWFDARDTSNPYFLFLHFFDAHWPYEAPEKFGGNNIYEEEVAFSCHYLNTFLEYLDKSGNLENTTIVCFSDHGEDLNGLYKNDKGGDELGHPEELGHGCLLYNQTQKVALIVCDDNLPKGINIETQVRLVDVAPTILDMFNIKHEKLDGETLLPIIKGDKRELLGYCETYYPEEQTQATGGKFSEANNKQAFIIDNNFKIIINLESNEFEFYNLKTDPDEKTNNYVR